MKRAGISFLMLFVLMLPWGTQVFAQNDSIFAPVYGNEKWSTNALYGQHAYGLLDARILEDENNQLTVTLYEVLPNGSTRPLYEIYANPNNRHTTAHYYLEGGKQYKIKAYSRGNGLGQLTNYIP